MEKAATKSHRSVSDIPVHHTQDQDPIKQAAQLVYELIVSLRSTKNPAFNKAILDLSCFCRTQLEILRRFTDAHLDQDQCTRLQAFAKKAVDDIIAWKSRSSGIDNNFGIVNELVDRVLAILFQTNAELGKARYFVLPKQHLHIYGISLLVCRTPEKSYHHLGSDGRLDEPVATRNPEFSNVFEHIGLRSGGVTYYDPNFFSRDPQEAAAFFTVGRVFSMLWDTSTSGSGIQDIVDDDPSVVEYRRMMTVTEGFFTGPYSGPTTSRKFLVMQAGARSSYCLPVTTLHGEGVAFQPDQENYGIIFTGIIAPTLRASEQCTTKPVFYVQSISTEGYVPGPKPTVANIPPPSRLPTRDLLPFSRVDYRRASEVEHNVRCQNVGIVERSFVFDKLGEFGFDTDRMDLD